MRFVEVAAVRPGRCAVLPQIGGHHAGGYIDTGSELDGFDNHVYVSVVAAQEMARMIGWASPTDVRELAARLEQAEAALVEAGREIGRQQAVIDAVDVLESQAFTKRRRPGRPSKHEEEVAA